MATPSASTTRFTINVANAERVILSIGGNKNGDTFLWPKSGDKYKKPGAMPSQPGPDIKEQHYSIHPSHESEDGNLIKNKMIMSDGQSEYAYHFTTAIKSGNSFAYLMARRCSHLNSSTFLLTKKSGTNISIDGYDPNYFSLLFGVLVGAPGLKFNTPLPRWLKVIQRTTNYIEIVLLWTFLPFGSHQSAFIRRRTTLRPTDDDIAKGLTNIQVDRTIAGLSPAECIRLFNSDCRDMKNEYLSVRTDLKKNVLSALDQTLELHRSGWMLTPEYIQFCQKLRAYGVVNIGVVNREQPKKT
jgi:hypothetical protein